MSEECYFNYCHNKATAMIRLTDDDERPICREHLHKMVYVAHSWRELKEEEEK